jgi:hypothetical protein
MKCKIGAVIKADKCKLTADVGNFVIAKLAKGDVKEAFRHLKGWYQKGGGDAGQALPSNNGASDQ